MNYDDRLDDALSLLKKALGLLDEVDAPADIGAHLDLAIHRLEASLGSVSNAFDGGSAQLRSSSHRYISGRPRGLKVSTHAF